MYGTRNENCQLGTGFFVQHSIVPAVKKVEFVSDRMSYIVPRGRRRNIIVLNTHALTEKKNDHSKVRFYEELEQEFYHFRKYHMKILLDFNAKLGREDIFKLTIGNESLREDSNDKGVRVLNFGTYKIYLLRVQCFRIETFINSAGLLLMGRLTIRSITY